MKTVLADAHLLVHGARQEAYAHPLDNFSRIARIWSAVLGCDVTPEQVGMCMAGVKLARQAHRPGRDNMVDLAGYAETVQMVIDERARREGDDGPDIS